MRRVAAPLGSRVVWMRCWLSSFTPLVTTCARAAWRSSRNVEQREGLRTVSQAARSSSCRRTRGHRSVSASDTKAMVTSHLFGMNPWCRAARRLNQMGAISQSGSRENAIAVDEGSQARICAEGMVMACSGPQAPDHSKEVIPRSSFCGRGPSNKIRPRPEKNDRPAVPVRRGHEPTIHSPASGAARKEGCRPGDDCPLSIGPDLPCLFAARWIAFRATGLDFGREAGNRVVLVGHVHRP